MPTIPHCNVTCDATGEILVDRSASGRERPWRDKKVGSERVAAAYRALGRERKAARIKDCGTVLTFAECPTDGHKRLRHANFCRDRLCPMCAWRRTLKLTAEVAAVLHAAVERRPHTGWVMLTLTQRNVSGDALRGEVDRILKGWDALRRRKDLRGVVGWLRVLEVTHNTTTGEWHPHIHALLWVRPSYWGADYVPQARWRELWGEVLELDYLPVVEVHRVRDRGGSRDKLQSVALEAGKYTVKDSDLLGDTPDDDVERIRVLDAALRGRRLIAWGGELRAIAREVAPQAQAPGEEDLVNVGDEPHHHGDTCPICGSQMLEHVYRWIRSIRYYVG